MTLSSVPGAPTVPNTQVDALGPNQSAILELNFFNSSTGDLTASLIDVLPPGLKGDPTFTPIFADYAGSTTSSTCVQGGATVNVTATSVTVSNFVFPNNPLADGGRPDCRIYVRVLADIASVPSGASNVSNIVPANAGGPTFPISTVTGGSYATGNGGPYQSTEFSASVKVLPAQNSGLVKAFAPSSIPKDGISVLSFTITNGASYPIHNVALTDPVPSQLAIQASPAPTSSCGGAVNVSGQNLSLGGGTIPAGGSCTVTASVKGSTGGVWTNNIPVSTMTSLEGSTNANPANATLTVRSDLSMTKTVNDYASISANQGQTFFYRVTFNNYSGALTNNVINDVLPPGIVVASTQQFVTNCGGTPVFTGAAGASSISVSGLTIPQADLLTGAAGTCNFYFSAKLAVASGTLTNTISPTDVTNTQGVQPAAASSAVVVAAPAPGGSGAPGGGNWGNIGAYKGFVDATLTTIATADVNAPFYMRFGAYNPSAYDWQFTNGTITDVLPLGIQVDVPGGPGVIPLVDKVDVWYQYSPPTASSAGPNNTNAHASFGAGCANTGVVAVTRAANGQDTITYSGWTTDAGGLHPQNTSWNNAGCYISIRLKGIQVGAYVGGAAPNKPINTIPANNVFTTEGATNPADVTAPIAILSAVGVTKAFNAYVVSNAGGKMRLTITLTNKASSPQTGATLTDTFPTDAGWSVKVASPPNAATTCAGGTLSATAGTGSFGITGATIPPGTIAVPGQCTMSVDVQVSGPADSGPISNVIPPGALTNDTPNLTNITEARANLYTRARNLTLNKTFANSGGATGGQPIPLTITVTGDRWAQNNVSFTDNLPPNVIVAPTPNASTTCKVVDLVAAPRNAYNSAEQWFFPSATVAATVTAVAGSSSVSLSNGYLMGADIISYWGLGAPAYNSCIVTVDVVGTTTDNKTNIIPPNNASSSEGATNASETRATMTVQPNTQLVKAFSPSTATMGTPVTLSLSVFNVNLSSQTAFTIQDTLRAGIVPTSIASNSCGGTASVSGQVISLTGATSVGPNASCVVVVNIAPSATGTYVNDQNDIVTSNGLNKVTTTTLTVTAATTFDLSIAKSIDTAVTPGPYLPNASTVNYNLIATNNGPGAAQERIVVTDCLPPGLSFNSASGGSTWTCANAVGPFTRGALTCSNEVTCTRNAGSGQLASGASANTITVVANVTAAATGNLTNYAQVKPAQGETLTETNLLGTSNGGYETGSPTAGSNNDDSKSISVTAATYSLGNRIWFDTNNDGILNNGEMPAPGVKLQLLDSAGAPIAGQTLTTDDNGYYRFDGLSAGTYAVQVTPDNWAAGGALVGYANSTPTATGNNNDNGITPVGTYGAAAGGTGVRSANVTLGLGSQPTGDVDAGATGAGANGTLGDAFDNLTVDFGFYRLTVGDTVWRDDGAGTAANYNNGIKDAGEPGIEGVTVQLLKGGTVVAVTTTDTNGNYIFTQQTVGIAAGEPLVADGDYTISIPAGQAKLNGTKSSVAPLAQPAVTSVGKATLDDGDKGLTTANAFTNATASAQFALAVSTTGTNADGNRTYGRDQGNVDNGTSHKPDMDFGFVPGYALGNRIWYDTNNDGEMNPGELPIDGVLVELTNAAGQKLYRDGAGAITTIPTGNTVLEATTTNDGYYLFDGLSAGDYRVRVAASNWASGGKLAGYANSTGATNASAPFAAADNNKDHGTNPATAAAYFTDGVSSATVTLGATTVGTGDTTEIAPAGTPPVSAAGDGNDNLTVDFGFYRLSVGNLVWSDSGSGGGVYNDGIKNGTEPGLPNVTVQLVDSTGTVVAQTRTDSNGNYSFNQLTSVPAVGTAGTPNGQPILPGNYTINIPPNQTPIAGATSSADTAGGRAVADSQDNGQFALLTSNATTSTAVTLTPGSTTIGSTPTDGNGTTDQPRMDFGFAPGFAIGNRVWYDTNNNGVIDAGEAMIEKVIVELLDSTGTVIQTKATGATGEYIFESLGTGNYTVRIAKENWTGLTASQVTNAGNPAGVAAVQKPLAGYNNSTGAGALTGTTTTDATDKGVDAADPTVAGISSATITLGAGLQPLNESATGDYDGVGTTTSIDANNNMTIDFGFYKLTVGDLVWKDDGNAGATPANINNGIFDAGEVGIKDVRVELYRVNPQGVATLVAVTTTDANGNYLFTQGTDGTGAANGKPLVPGADYQVRIPQATATVNAPLINLLSSAAAVASETTPLGVNSDDSGVGTAAASSGVTPSVNFTLGAGTAAGANSIPTNATGTTAQPNVDFGFAPSYSLGNRVWVDTNNNGIIDGAEVGLGGITVTLLDSTGTPVPGVAALTTDSNGYYRFDNLPAGNYIVQIAPPAVNGVNYVSSTGQNASATGPYEAGLTSAATGTNNKDHGTQATPTTIRSGVVAVGPTALINGEVDAAAANVGANGPNGDAFDVLTVDFGIFLPAKLGNLVWFDVNKNGTVDPAEPGLNNVSVILRDLNGVEIARQVTRNNPDTGNPSYYQFDYLIPGQYRVEFSAPGYFGTTPGTPSIVTGTGPDTNNSQIQPGRDLGTTQLVTLAPGDNNPQLDAGYIVPPVEVPTLSDLMKLLLAMMMLSIGVIAVRTRQR